MATVADKITKRRPRDIEVCNGYFFKIRNERKSRSVPEDLNRDASTEHKSKDGRRDA